MYSLLWIRLLASLPLLIICIPPSQTVVSRVSNFTTLTRLRRQAPNCFVVINEANIDHPGTINKQYIELVQVCNADPDPAPAPSLQNYKLVILRGHPVQIVFVLDLSEFTMKWVNDLGYAFLLGGAGVSAYWKLDLGDARIQSIFDNNELPYGDESPYGILLMYSKQKKDLSNIKITKRDANGKLLPRTIDFDFNIMKQYTLDLLVYGRKVHTNRCNIFEKIMQRPDFANNADRITFQGEQYLLRDTFTEDQDLSLNRCTSESTPFVPRRFRLGKPTPGAENDCSGATFFIENHLSKLALKPAGVNDSPQIESCEPDTPGVSTEKYRDLPMELYNRMLQHELSRAKEDCASENLHPVATAMDQVMLNSNNKAIESLGKTPASAVIPPHQFDTHLAHECKSDFPFNGEILSRPEIQSWLDIGTLGGEECRYSCYFCKHYFALGFKADARRKRSIMSPEGYHSIQPTRNKNEVLEHMGSAVHQEAVNLLTELSLAASQAQLDAILSEAREKETGDLRQTINHVILNYAERLAGVSWSKHNVFITALQMMNLDMGVHHFHAVAAEQMNEVLSNSFHETLLKFLVEENNEFSFMADASTDNTNIPYLVCYVQSLEDGYPMTYFYRLIELPNGESAESIFTAVKLMVEEDDKLVPGFKAYFQSKLAAVATDGHPVMIGSQNSFYTRLVSYVDRYIPIVWCFSHRLDLGIKKGLLKQEDKDFEYFKYFEGLINKFYVFYMSYGSKTWQHLTEIAEDLGLNVRRIRYFFTVRWSSSHYEAIKSIYSSYSAILLDLIAIGQDDSEFNQKARDNARELHAVVEDKTFAYLIHEYMDFLYLFKQISEAFQESEGLLVAKAKLVQSVLDQLGQLKTNPGKYVTEFLKKCSSEHCASEQCTVDLYFQSPYVTVGGIALRDNGPKFDFPKLRSKMYDALIEGIKSYFNLPLLKNLEIFDPSSFQEDVTSSLANNQPPNAYCTSAVVTLQDWTSICKFFFDDNKPARSGVTAGAERRQRDKDRCEACVSAFNDWKQLVSAISRNLALKANYGETPAAFWFLALMTTELPWTPTLRTIINYVLVTPFGSSDCERGFSILTTVKTKYRNRLSAKTVDHILRVKINGPADITQLKAARYAREFLKKHIRPDDLSFKGGRKKNPVSEKSFRKSSRLF